MNWKDAVKYFVHGVVFMILFTVLVIIWSWGLLVLVGFGSFIGFMLGFILLIVIVGAINAVITEELWFSVSSEFRDVTIHGFVLFIALLVINGIVVLAPQTVLPGVVTSIVTRIIACFLDGYVGKHIASFWEGEEIPEYVEIEWKERNV